jgi:hypothetical protein
MTRSRSLRAGTAAVAAVCALVLVGACSGSDGDQAEIAKQDRAVVQHDKAVAEYRAKITAALREKWQKRAKARWARARARAHARRGRPPTLVRTRGGRLVPSGRGICTPIPRSADKAGRAARRARLRRRKQALDYLNLRCPSLGVPRL